MKVNNKRKANKARSDIDDNEDVDPSTTLSKKMRTSAYTSRQSRSTVSDNNQALTPCNNNIELASPSNPIFVLPLSSNRILPSSNGLQPELASSSNILSPSLSNNNVDTSPPSAGNISSSLSNLFTTSSIPTNIIMSNSSNDQNITLPPTTNDNMISAPPDHILNQQSHSNKSNSRRNVSNVWLYATKSEDGKTATCGICGFTCTTASHSTSTIRYHLIRRHNKVELIINSEPVSVEKSAISNRFKQELHNLCYNAIVMDHRPFNDLRKRGISLIFDKLCPGFVPPHRNQVSIQLRRMYNQQYQILKEELKLIDHIGLTLDFWSTRSGISCLCITGHWYNDTADFFSKIIHFSSFNERHTAVNIAGCIKQILIDLEIYEKIISITCDGGENLVAACRKLDVSIKRIWCCAHRLHLVVINALGFWNKEKKVGDKQTVDLSREVPPATDDAVSKQHEELMETNMFNSPETDASLSNEIDDHAIIEDDVVMFGAADEYKDIENAEESDPTVDDDPNIETQDLDLIHDNWSTSIDTNVITIDVVKLNMKILKKCRSIATMSRKSSIISNFLRSLSLNTIISNDCKSRWNSTSKLIDSVIKNKNSLIKLFLDKRSLKLRKEQFDKLSEIELSIEDWDFLTSLSRVLKPFACSTVMMSGKNYPSIGLAYHAIHKLKSFCESEGENEHIKELKQLLLEKIYKYFCYDLEQFDHFQKHAYFDPCAHLSFNDAEKNQCEKYIKTLILNNIYPRKRMGSDSIQTASSMAIVPTSSQRQNLVLQDTSSKQSAYDEFLAACGEQDFTQETIKEKSTRISLNDELKWFRIAVQEFNSKHKPSTKSVLEFWKTHYIQLPLLWNLAKVHLVTSGTSVASESAFSCSAYVARKERARLSIDNLAFSVFLKDKLDKQ
ncbi:unnamed protein product [Adineta ricciae]|uniref:BED-type domain-containing protein n=1 Tax=Adineta ricciae TaxID=249248 RepID=A0A816CQY9_ADIRI|nr:unnamed protein product [Adineta ricciae]CAF1625032.1 unnamed protein product [Adineta ricciae]